MKLSTRTGAVLLAASLLFGINVPAAYAAQPSLPEHSIREEDVLTGTAKTLFDAIEKEIRQAETSFVRVAVPVPAEPVAEDVKDILAYIKNYMTDTLYWWDKQSGVVFACNYDKIKKTADMYLAFDVIAKYRGEQRTGGDGVDYWKLKLDLAADTREAERILKNRPQGDAAAIRYFADEICKLTSYDYEVILGDEYTTAFQMASVFDGDPKTLSVCEGYSKALKYLCDRSGIACLLVEGLSPGGAHMWNMVWLDGEWWLVDLTQTDAEYDTDPDKLVLVGKGSEEYRSALLLPSNYRDSERLTEKDRYGSAATTATAKTDSASRVDTMRGNAVESRVYVPAGVPDGLDFHVSVSEPAALAHLGKFYRNKMAALRLKAEGDFGAEVEVATKASLVEGMDTENLVFYSFDVSGNRFTRIKEPKYSIDKSGYLHFFTPTGGTIIISEGEFKK